MKFYLTEEEKEKIRNLKVLKVRQVAHFLEASHTTVLRLIKRNYLKASRSKIHKRIYLIKAEELIRFLEELSGIR